jgi:tetraacyldisaccharide 4'-kinase
MRAPDFWQGDSGIARLLEPLGLIYGAVTARRMARAKPYRATQPVICVGNLTVGGTGKTPVAASIAARLSDQGRSPAILIRGYGGSLKGPVRVSGHSHTVDEVGDEALLHARHVPTWVARERSAAAPLAIAAGADVLIMDDGHQHPSLAKDLSLLVVDGFSGFGNGRIVPAGPLRENVAGGLARADAIVLMGDDPHGLEVRLSPKLPVLRARLALGPEWQALRGQRVVAFAGIGGPERFYNMLQAVGAQIVAFHPFGDHYGYAAADIEPMLDEAYNVGAIPVTTVKDAVRLDPDQRQQVNVLTVTAEWEDPGALDSLLDKALARG